MGKNGEDEKKFWDGWTGLPYPQTKLYLQLNYVEALEQVDTPHLKNCIYAACVCNEQKYVVVKDALPLGSGHLQ